MKRAFYDSMNVRPPLTIWSSKTRDLVPERFRRIITVVMPLIYLCMALFGIASLISPVPTFTVLVGPIYGTYWAAFVALASIFSFVGLVFRLQLEIYTSIFLSFLLAIYPFYVGVIVFHDGNSIGDLSRLGVIFAVATYPIMPIWRVVDIVLEIRKAKQRKLFAASPQGEAKRIGLDSSSRGSVGSTS